MKMPAWKKVSTEAEEARVPKRRKRPLWMRLLWYVLGGIGGAIFLLYFYLFITA